MYPCYELPADQNGLQTNQTIAVVECYVLKTHMNQTPCVLGSATPEQAFVVPEPQHRTTLLRRPVLQISPRILTVHIHKYHDCVPQA